MLAPRIFIVVDAPGSPATAFTITLDAFAARELPINDSPERVISAAATETLDDPCSSRLALKPKAVTLTAFIPIASTPREKFWLTEPPTGISTDSEARVKPI